MTNLLHSFSLPWWFWMMLGGAIIGYVTHKGFHKGIDELVSYMLGLEARKPHKKDKRDEDDDDTDSD